MVAESRGSDPKQVVGVAGPPLFMCELQKFVGGHLDDDDTLAKPTQQVLMDGSLVVPRATLSNEL